MEGIKHKKITMPRTWRKVPGLKTMGKINKHVSDPLQTHMTVDKSVGKGKTGIAKSMVHAVMVKWKCSVCGGFESDTGKFSYDYEPLKLKEDSMLRAKDITGHGEPIDLCPRCIYKAAVLVKDMLTIGEQGKELAWMVKAKPEGRPEEKKGWLRKK